MPGLNPAIRAVTIRALREGYKVIGIRRGWGGLVDTIRDKDADNSDNFQTLTQEIVNRAGRTGGTFLHSSRTNPGKVKKEDVPAHLQDKYAEKTNDLTPEILKNPDFLGVDYLVPIGGDDTLATACVCIKRDSKSLPFLKRWITTCPALITASDSAPASRARSRLPTACVPAPVRMNAL